jgi:hypothetical protein
MKLGGELRYGEWCVILDLKCGGVAPYAKPVAPLRPWRARRKYGMQRSEAVLIAEIGWSKY